MMRLHDMFEPYEILHVNEVFNTKVPVDNWHIDRQTLVGELTVDNTTYHILLEPNIHQFEDEVYNFINVAFAKFVNGQRVQTFTFDKENPANASKVIGAIINATYEKLSEYSYDAIVLIAVDNVAQRMRIYNAVAKWEVQKTGTSMLQNVHLPGACRATIVFAKTFNPEAVEAFTQFIGKASLSKP